MSPRAALLYLNTTSRKVRDLGLVGTACVIEPRWFNSGKSEPAKSLRANFPKANATPQRHGVNAGVLTPALPDRSPGLFGRFPSLRPRLLRVLRPAALLRRTGPPRKGGTQLSPCWRPDRDSAWEPPSYNTSIAPRPSKLRASLREGREPAGGGFQHEESGGGARGAQQSRIHGRLRRCRVAGIMGQCI